VIKVLTHIAGARMNDIKDNDLTVNGVNPFQLLAPIVLGKISDKYRIAIVIKTATTTSPLMGRVVPATTIFPVPNTLLA
jgi:hypothetical protein